MTAYAWRAEFRIVGARCVRETSFDDLVEKNKVVVPKLDDLKGGETIDHDHVRRFGCAAC